jgi:hypothetical protein
VVGVGRVAVVDANFETMVFKDYKKAVAAAKESCGTLKANPEGEGWVVFKKTPIQQKTPKPKQKKHSKVSLDYLIKKPKKSPSPSPSKKPKKSTPSSKKPTKHHLPYKIHKIPESQRRKVDDGIGGSREAWTKKRKGYIGDGRYQ